MSSAHLTRLYLDSPLTPGSETALSRASSHHVSNVLRLSSGAPLILFNGDGSDYPATIIRTGKIATVRVETRVSGRTESPLELELIQGISRGDRMDTSLQKAVELGVQQIQPVFTDYCKVRLSGERLKKKIQHWSGVMISACEQSGRSVVPDLAAPQTLRDYLATLSGQSCNWFCHPGNHTLIGDLELTTSRCRLLIGPESGLSEAETTACLEHGFKPLSLGSRILRTETAGPAAIAILQARFGDLTSVDRD